MTTFITVARDADEMYNRTVVKTVTVAHEYIRAATYPAHPDDLRPTIRRQTSLGRTTTLSDLLTGAATAPTESKMTRLP